MGAAAVSSACPTPRSGAAPSPGGLKSPCSTWAHAHGTPRTDEECNVWNRFIAKLGWRDERSHLLPDRIRESGLTGKPIETLIDQIEFDEGRDPVAARAWEKI